MAVERSMPARGSDLVEAGATVLLAVLGIVGLLAAVLVGDDVHERALTRAWGQSAQYDEPRPAAEHSRSRALIDQGDHPSPPASSDRSKVGERRGITEVNLVPPSSGPPPNPRDRSGWGAVGSRRSVTALVLAFWTVVLVLAGVLFVLWLAWLVVTRGTAARNSHRWARDWAAVEPVWSGRGPGGPSDRP